MKFKHFFSQPRRSELDEELRQHFEHLVEENIKRGLSPEEARREARVSFGSFETSAEQTSAEYPGWWLDTFRQDLRYALRGLRRNKVFATAAILTLALGIGATTAVFSVVDRILFRSLPYAHDDRLVSVGLTAPILPEEFMLGSGYYLWKDHQTPFEAYTSWSGVNLCDLSEANPAHLACAQVASDFLPTLGIGPILGRTFTRDEDVPTAPHVALISHGLWKSRFGRAPDVLGKTMSIDGEPTRILGVLPPTFEAPSLQHVDIVMPQRMNEAEQRRMPQGRILHTIGRLKPGITIPQAIAQLQPLFQESLNAAPARFRDEVHLRVRSLRDYQVHDARLMAWVLLAAVFAVLLIAGANVSGLLLARSAERQMEFAIRQSLGASRWRLLSQMVTEALLLSIFGIAIGVGVGEALLRIFVSLAPSGIPYMHQAELDGRVLAFAIVIAIVCGLVLGSAPFWSHELRRQRAIRSVAGPGRARIRQALLVAQLSVTLVLLAAASLLLQTARNLQTQSLGIRTGQLITATVHFARQSYPDGTKKMQFANALEERLRQLPGVEEIAISDSIPPGGLEHDHIFGAIALDGKPKPDGGTGGSVAWRWVTPSYFPNLGIRILKGSNFTEEQRNSNDHFLILSEAMAARLFPGEDPIGKRVDPNSMKIWYTVVGVAANAKNGGLATENRPEYYRLWRNRPEDWNWGLPGVGVVATFIFRSPADAARVASLVRREVAGIDGSMPVEFETMREHVSSLAERPRFEAALLTLFAGFAVVLAAIGLYGVIAFIVSRRTVEIAVRMALGAGRREILKLIGREGIKVIVAAIVLGAAGALAVSRAFAALLFGVKPSDALTLVSAAAVLLLVAAAAMLIPLRRALSVDPMRALRYE